MKLGRFNTASNYLSLLRLFLAIPFWILLSKGSGPNYWAAGLALFAGFTDLGDGYLARKLNQVTEWGKVLDPLADKVCMAAIVIQLFLVGKLEPALFWIIISRDILIIIASVLLSNKVKEVIPSNYLGKITVLILCFYVLFLMLDMELLYPLVKQGFYILSMVMIAASVVGYGKRGMEIFRKNN